MRLFEPAMLGTMRLRNRLIMAPMTNNLSDEDGFATERMIRFYEERAKGGVGLVTVEDAMVDAPGGNHARLALAIDDDRYMPALTELARRVKAHGAAVMIHLSHGGRRGGRVSLKTGRLERTRGKIPVAPSKIAHPETGYVVPRALEIEEIEELVEKFARAARRAAEAGFDSIGLHCAHMHLLGQFLSPWANVRTDRYGGDLEGRFRFFREITAAVKKEVGDDYPLIARINGAEPPGGNTAEDIRTLAKKMQEIGIHAIHVSTGLGVSIKSPEMRAFLPAITPMRMPEGCIVPLAENVKRAVDIPVIAVNMIRSFDYAEGLLQEGRADFIAMGRPLIADPDLPNKAMRGQYADIRPCISCCHCYQNITEKDTPVACGINPLAAREGELDIRPAAKPRRVLVVGGGPAGLTAAITAGQRGHSVELYEKAAEVGGQLLIGSRPPGKGQIDKLTRFLRYQAEQVGVRVVTGKGIDAGDLRDLNPDVVVLAAGSRPAMPPIPGIDSAGVVTAWDVLWEKVQVGERVVVVGGGEVGAETAEFLAERGKRVSIVEMLPAIAAEQPGVVRQPLLFSLEDHGVAMFTQSTVREIRNGEVIVDRKGKEICLPADTVVIAVGAKAETGFVARMKEVAPEALVIGDAARPGQIVDAIRSGFEAALGI